MRSRHLFPDLRHDDRGAEVEADVLDLEAGDRRAAGDDGVGLLFGGGANQHAVPEWATGICPGDGGGLIGGSMAGVARAGKWSFGPIRAGLTGRAGMC